MFRGFWLLFMLLLAGCAFVSPADAPPLAPTARPAVTPRPESGTPTPYPPDKVYVDLFMSVADADTEEPVEVDIVWLDFEIAYRHVSRFVLLLEGDYPAGKDGYEIRLIAAGYQPWSTRVRPRSTRSHSMNLPIHMHRVKPQGLLTLAGLRPTPSLAVKHE